MNVESALNLSDFNKTMDDCVYVCIYVESTYYRLYTLTLLAILFCIPEYCILLNRLVGCLSRIS